MKKLILLSLCFALTSCAQMIPGLTQAIDDALTDEAVGVTIDKAAMQKDTDVKIKVDILNKILPTLNKS